MNEYIESSEKNKGTLARALDGGNNQLVTTSSKVINHNNTNICASAPIPTAQNSTTVHENCTVYNICADVDSIKELLERHSH